MTTVTSRTVPELTLGWRLQMALGDMQVQDMAMALGVNRATVGRWMHDKGAPPKRAYLLQWAMITGVDPDWLVTGRPPKAGHDPGDGEPLTFGSEGWEFESLRARHPTPAAA